MQHDRRRQEPETIIKQISSDYEREVHRPFNDSLTGVFNHGIFQILLDLQAKRYRRYGVPFTLAFIDLDAFAFYNRRYSALEGDRLLQRLAELTKLKVRQVDIIARYANDMFAVILEGVDASTASLVAERLRLAIVQDPDIPLTVSIGLAGFPQDASDKDELIHKAELALQQAKLRGKNRVYFFEREEPLYNEELPKVLVVDDDERNLKLLAGLLHSLDCEIVKSTSGAECLHILEKTDIDLVLLDVMMPGIDGFEVCRHIKQHEHTRMIPVILVTALDDREAKVRGIEAGADDFITKPPNKIELLARTRTLIHLKQMNNNLTSIENVLFSLANSVEAKDVNTQGHIERVANMAVMLGERLGIRSKGLKALRFGGMLHDIGKIGIPGKILNKPGPLSPEEDARMKEHPEIGYKICLPLKTVLGAALDVIRHHHEKLDGSGYPDGLRGDELPMVARIMAVVDIYDALISDRPYRHGLPKNKVLSILHREAQEGKLDSTIVESLIEMLS